MCNAIIPECMAIGLLLLALFILNSNVPGTACWG
ncbi:hypothetical protein PanWU01x14_230400 [Parasponia andersonii]|uniref:Uncharacterized protein n=1 Tax=Parasponia andersonii TaxID=3476 RepID=A0A2P5BKP8_PARAD|nr:hypothetical protein PanWU01x14_230400 [Parasponia andersonii]